MKGWVIPPKRSAEFVARMEDVLDVYERPVDPKRPVLCMDEASKQLVGEVRQPTPPGPGRVARADPEYVRRGTANLFLAYDATSGKRHVSVTDARTRRDWATFMRDLLDGPYRDAEQVVLVMDNLNTHGDASFYDAFDAEEANRLKNKLEIHHTPKHGSWLNMAEIELSALGRQCLARRIPEKGQLAEQVSAWTAARNGSDSRIDWRFTTADARQKLRKLYPSAEP